MTANKAPEKIYLQVDPDEWIDGITWCEDRINDSDVEYVRSDRYCTCPDIKWQPKDSGRICPCCGRKIRGEEDEQARAEQD